jgi:predicted DNA-binding transcriptional regulator AlpA
MKHAGLSVAQLAARTREVDPDGRGLSKASVGFAVSAGASGRDEVSDRAAALIAAALDVAEELLFHDDAQDSPEAPAATPSRLRSEMPAPAQQADVEPFLDEKELCRVTKKSRDWYFDQRRQHPPGSATPFPVHFFGRSPRYRLSEVTAWCAEVFAPVAA